MSAHMGAHFLSRDKMIKSEGGKRERWNMRAEQLPTSSHKNTTKQTEHQLSVGIDRGVC